VDGRWNPVRRTGDHDGRVVVSRPASSVSTESVSRGRTAAVGATLS